MVNKKISELTAGTALTGTESIPAVQGASTVKVTAADIAGLAEIGGGSPVTYAQVKRTTVQSIPNAVFTPIVFDTETVDTAGVADIVADNDGLTVPAGTWVIGASLAWADNNGGERIVSVDDGVDTYMYDRRAASQSSDVTMATLIHTTTPKTLQLKAYQSAGVAINTETAGHTPSTLWAMKVDKAGITAASPVTAKVTRQVTTQSIATAATAAMIFDTEVWDEDGLVDLGTGNTRITIKNAGIYHIKAGVSFDSAALTGQRALFIRKNGTTTLASHGWSAGGSGATAVGTVAVDDMAVAGDYYEVLVYQNSGGAVNLAAEVRNFLSVTKAVANGMGIQLAGESAVTGLNHTPTTTTFVDMNAADAAITFTAITSAVVVRLQGWSDGLTGTTLSWNLRDANGDIAGTARDILHTNYSGVASCSILVQSLKVGQSYTWKWGIARTFGTGAVGVNSTSATVPIEMQVWSVGSGNTSDSIVTITQQSAAYTLRLQDAGTEVEYTGAGAANFTVPPNSTTAFATGTVINIRQYGAGQVTLVAGAGVTLRSRNGLKTAGQYATLSLIKRAADEWVVSGDTVA